MYIYSKNSTPVGQGAATRRRRDARAITGDVEARLTVAAFDGTGYATAATSRWIQTGLGAGGLDRIYLVDCARQRYTRKER